MGNNDYMPKRESNPKGFFEDKEVNDINEAILSKILPNRPTFLGKWLFRSIPLHNQRWLSRVPVGTKVRSSSEINARIQKLVSRTPFCFKDPRFSYTLPIWKPFLNKNVFVCVFRNPNDTALSILKECKYDQALYSLSINLKRALQIWELMYKHILEVHRHNGEWLFLHYDQIFNQEGLEKLQSFTGAILDYSFPDASLNRTHADMPINGRVLPVYRQLCGLSGYNDPST